MKGWITSEIQKAEPYDRAKNLTEKLESGMKALYESDKYKSYLKAMSQFHNYSPRNVMLILLQNPEATRVASYRLWKDQFNRQVMKGEKAIHILAPIIVRTKEERRKTDELLSQKLETAEPIIDDNGNIVIEEKEKQQLRFKYVPVFDIAQTQGDPLPELAENLTGNVAHYEAFIETLREISPLPIIFEAIPEDRDGYCRYGEHIGIRGNMSEVQTVSALIHEIAHAKIHENSDIPKAVKELEAESISYVVCQRYQIETGDNSFGYLAGWSSRDMSEFMSALDTIRRESSNLIAAVDDAFHRICKERGEESQITNETADVFSIYQLKDIDELRNYRFSSLEQLGDINLTVDKDNYDLIYTAPLPPKETLDNIYQRFNIDSPVDFTGHSLSVSDVIVIQRGEEISSYYIDNSGFTELPVFFEKEQQMKEVNTEETKKDQTVYMKSPGYARENNEVDLYRSSLKLNIECAAAIDSAIKDCIVPDGNGYRLTPESVNKVIDIYGEQRVSIVLANTVRLQDWDGRYSSGTKEWARNTDIPKVGDERDFFSRAHPAVLEGYIGLTRREIEKKPSVIKALRQTPDKSAQNDSTRKNITQKNNNLEV